MKTEQNLFSRLQAMTLVVALLAFNLISCGSDDNEEEVMQIDQEPSLELTIGGTTYRADFTGNNAAIIATTNPNINWTAVTLGGTTDTGETINFSIVFEGKSTGTSTVSASAGEDENAPQGLTVALVISNNGTIESVQYDAVNVNINITSYKEISGVTAEVEGTFSGTVEDDDGNTTNISGSFNTGTL